ncbi:MAG: hypothetical protein ACPL1K_05925, partial [Candidatus Kryptoniota bacterium]
VGARVMGRTPLSINIDCTRNVPLILRHAGFKDYVIPSGSVKEGLMMVKMLKEPGFNRQEKSEGMLFGVPVSVISAAGIASGIAAAYFKINADKMFASYQSQAFSGYYDNRLLKKVNQYDRISAASLAVMEVCAAALVYYLFMNE